MSEVHCKWCGQTYEQHDAERSAFDPVPKMPCLGLRDGFVAWPDRPLTYSPPLPLNQLAAEIHEINVSKGFDFDATDPRAVTEKLCLVHSELSEALEELRDGNPERVVNGKPEGVGAECIDVLVRTLHILHKRGVDIDALMRAKLEFNKGRGYLHGRKF